MAKLVLDAVKDHGTHVVEGAVPSKIEKLPSGQLRVTSTDNNTIGEFDTVLLAVGKCLQYISTAAARLFVKQMFEIPGMAVHSSNNLAAEKNCSCPHRNKWTCSHHDSTQHLASKHLLLCCQRASLHCVLV
jgi:hypothetical protein